MIGDTYNALEGLREILVKGLLVESDGSIARGVRHQLIGKKFCGNGKVSVSRRRRRREKKPRGERARGRPGSKNAPPGKIELILLHLDYFELFAPFP